MSLKTYWHRLLRWRHRRGYGIHSPWAFALVTGVIYEKGDFYAYADLPDDRNVKLLFRLANDFQPKKVILYNGISGANAIHKACLTAQVSEETDNNCERIEMIRDDGEKLVIVPQIVDNQTNKAFWQELLQNENRVTFDLYELGLCYLNLNLTPQDYCICY